MTKIQLSSGQEKMKKGCANIAHNFGSLHLSHNLIITCLELQWGAVPTFLMTVSFPGKAVSFQCVFFLFLFSSLPVLSNDQKACPLYKAGTC